MRLIPFLLLVLCALLEPFPVARAFEGARTPVIVGFQVDGIEPYESFVSNTKAAVSEVLDDRAFIFKPIAREALSNPDRTAELDYLFCSAGVFAALQHYAGFSPVASAMPTFATGPNHASALVLLVRRGDKHVRTVGDLRKAAVGIGRVGAPEVTMQLKEELALRGIEPDQGFRLVQLESRNVEELLAFFSDRQLSVEALALPASPRLDAATLKRYDLRVLEPRLDDDLRIAHTSATYPGWVLSASYKTDFESSQRMGTFLRTLTPVDGSVWTTPADFRALHDILQRSDPFYSGFQPKSIRDYIREHQSWVVTALIFIICMVMHIVRTGQLLRKRTEELNAANVEKLESERRFHLLEKQNIVGQLSSVVAHEIRQPLAAVSNYAMALRRRHENDELDDSALAYGLERLVVESDRANEIVDYVQKYVRTSEKSKARIDVSELLTEMGKDYTDSNGEMFVELDVREGLRYYMDPMELNLMVRNLVKNALEASRSLQEAKCAKVLLSCGVTAEGGLSINVSDSGPALTDEAFRRLTQPLNSTKIGGLGLGLSIVRLIAESYGGHVEFSRRTPTGLSVTIVLPPSQSTSEKSDPS